MILPTSPLVDRKDKAPTIESSSHATSAKHGKKVRDGKEYKVAHSCTCIPHKPDIASIIDTGSHSQEVSFPAGEEGDDSQESIRCQGVMPVLHTVDAKYQ